ncbi:MAG: exodeoxyribonuclease VII large subunit, partial [Rhodobacteraceae bacterium]|nr:exodeoxyribonuclease VII large subunit [Paracoccaceae bacterium]
PRLRFARLADRLEALDRTRVTLGYAETLKRGYAVVRGDGAVVTSKAGAEQALALEIEFRDGRLVVAGRAGKKLRGPGESGQGSLF